MAENIFASFDISGQGMSVQRMRLSATANNIANVNTTKSTNGEPFKREIVIVEAIPHNDFQNELGSQISLNGTNEGHVPNGHTGSARQSNQVLNAYTGSDNSQPRLVYEPNHPDANEEGYVEYPNINIVTEMVEMISAQRAFQANVSVVQSAKNIARDALDI